MPTFEGGCHCGAVRFRVDVAADQRDVLDCNCTICAKKGFLHLIVPHDRFTLIAGADRIVTYSFGTNVAQHMFCSVCGIHSFYRPRSHPDHWDVNARCLNAQMSYWTIKPFDGANWEDNVELIR